MSDDMFAALFASMEESAVKFYAFLDQHDNILATGTSTSVEFASKVEINEADHALCLEKGADLLELNNGKLVVKEFEAAKSKKLIYVDYRFELAAVEIKIKNNSASALLNKRGLVELENYASRGSVTNRIWILDADYKHRCVAELEIGCNSIMDSVKLDYIPKRIVAATYPTFSGYTFEIE